ncbi:FGGY-family carbohydrate kinase [Paenibacillus allorhizosphaerae]|uniref:D-ribulose kinase n=1 Tax=Paenibacillus allorhizosphaerae TaxID=2849866 RepID=A0ABM8VQV6_9BACL|nr:FGGY-family carbohydrate kinase [Paenibacillus allorhizosphaerae]CAG7654634.1 D-ribulose kinase [Paenibacillus allorhizosphaerae]
MSHQQRLVVIGTDIGTQGVRVMALNDHGELLSSHAVAFSIEGSREEQSPAGWWRDLLSCLTRLMGDLNRIVPKPEVKAISVTSTSGTMIALDARHEPVSPALMYSDPRSFREAQLCKAAAERAGSAGYTAFNASSGLPKMLWFREHDPSAAERIELWAHATDYIVGKLSGVWGVTDYSNCLKTGYDLVQEQWPGYVTGELGIPASWLPKVVPPGTVLGTVAPEVAEATGLPRNVLVVTGMTDGCTSQIASGAIRPGEWSTTIGTTLVVKGVTREPIDDPLGRLYNHKHPQGFWMPGGASNTGGDWVSRDYAGADLAALNREAASLVPTPWICYPLLQHGERFPFVAAGARGFDHGGLTAEQRFAARMEGVAYLERLAYEMIEALSGETVANVYTAGGASTSPVWLGIRSSVLRRPIRKMKHVEGAVGAAVLAASGTLFSGLEEAGSAMIAPEQLIEPWDASVCEKYDDNYRRFVERLRELGYLADESESETA